MFSYIFLNHKIHISLAVVIMLIANFLTTISKAEFLTIDKEIQDDLNIIVKNANNKKWIQLKNNLNNKNNKVLMNLSDWIYFTSNSDKIDLEKLKTYYLEYKYWPSSKKILIAIENKLKWHDQKISETKDWFKNFKPITNIGKIKLYDLLLMENGNNDFIKKEYINNIKNNWITGIFNKKDEKFIIEKYSDYFNEKDHFKRLNNLIWNKRWNDSRRQIKRVSKEHALVATAKIKLARRSYGVDESIAKIPQNLLNDEGLIYERVKWRRKYNLRQSSLDLLKNFLSNNSEINNPTKWWIEINWHARKLLDMNMPEEAYSLLKNHKQKSVLNISNAEWLLGWISLQYLKNPEEAKIHFLKMNSIVKMPISISRSNYWLGRTEHALGNNNNSIEYFKKAATFNSTYYGMLANDKIDNGDSGEKEYYSSFKILNNDIADKRLDVLNLLSHSNEQKLNRKFINGLILNNNENKFLENIFNILYKNKRTDLFIIAVKNAIKYNTDFQKYLFPFPNEISSILEKSIIFIDLDLLLSVAKQESEFYTHAKSRSGALGILQVMPRTAKLVTKQMGIPYNKKRLNNDINYNINIATRYLNDLLLQYDDNLVLALAAYNAGPTRINRWIKVNGNPKDNKVDSIDWIEKIPFKETRNYVQRIIENYIVYQKVIEDRKRPKRKSIKHILDGEN